MDFNGQKSMQVSKPVPKSQGARPNAYSNAARKACMAQPEWNYIVGAGTELMWLWNVSCMMTWRMCQHCALTHHVPHTMLMPLFWPTDKYLIITHMWFEPLSGFRRRTARVGLQQRAVLCNQLLQFWHCELPTQSFSNWGDDTLPWLSFMKSYRWIMSYHRICL